MSALRIRRLLLAGALGAPLAWLLYLALVAPDVRFLPPGPGEWIVDSRWQIRKKTPDPFPPTRYRTRLAIAELPSELPVDVTALGDFRVAVNRRLRFDSATMVRHWKRPVRLDLAPWLEPGENEILLEVRNQEGIQELQGATPLRVAGAMPSLTTGTGSWQAAAQGLDWSPAALAGIGEAELRCRDFRWRWPLLYRGSILLALGLAAAAWLRRAAASPSAGRAAGWLRLNGPALAVLVVVAAAQLWNASHFPYRRSRMDWGGHVEHIRYNAETWRPPLAEEGWMMYHPPLYYWAAGVVYRASGGDDRPARALRRVQLLGGLCGALHMALAFLILSRFGPASARARALALLALGLAPMSLVTNAMITNEPFAAWTCGLALTAGALLLARPASGVKTGLLLGLLAGLALLGKFTGLTVGAALAVVYASRWLETRGPRRRRAGLGLLALVLTAAVVAGPYYFRNFKVYGKFFVGPHDPVTGHFFVQEPGYRTADFYTRFGDVFFHEPERARWSSLWDGLYASTWGEVHKNFLSPRDERGATRQLLIFVLAILPTAAVLGGGLRTVARAATPGKDSHVGLLLVTMSAFGFAVVAAYTMMVPHASTVKAFFLLNLTLPAAFFLAEGYARMERGLGRARPALDLAGLAMAALTLELFLWR